MVHKIRIPVGTLFCRYISLNIDRTIILRSYLTFPINFKFIDRLRFIQDLQQDQNNKPLNRQTKTK